MGLNYQLTLKGDNMKLIAAMAALFLAQSAFASNPYPYWTAYAAAHNITPVEDSASACTPEPKGHYLCWTSGEMALYGNCVGRGLEPIGQKSVELHFKQLANNEITEDYFINMIAHSCDRYKGTDSEKYISCNKETSAAGNTLCMSYCLDAQNSTKERCAPYVQYNSNVPTLQFAGSSFPGAHFKPTDKMAITAQVNAGDAISACAATTSQKASCEDSANYRPATDAGFSCGTLNGAMVCSRTKTWESVGLPSGNYYICVMNARTQDKNCRTIIVEKKR
jgi:hypothetical protein